MNKIFTKIVGAALGLAMAIGVGVGVASISKEVTPVYAAGGTFKKITSTSDLTSGAKYLIVSESDKLAFDGSLTKIDAVSNTKSVTISNSQITATEDFYFTITSKTGGYSIKSSKGLYIGSTTNNNELKSGTSDSYTNTITWDSNNSCFVIKGSTSYLVYNSTKGQTRFRYFKPTTCNNGLGTGAYHKISLFKEQTVTNYTVTFAVNTAGYGTVSSSSLSVPSGSSISVDSNKVTINNTTVTATPSAKTAQYTYAFSSWSNTSGTVTAARTITANFTRTTNTFTVGGTITNGALSSTAEVEYGSPLNININPDSGYKLPSTLTSVTMGGSAYAGYTYDSVTGAFSIASVTGNVVINAECPYDGKTYDINVTVTNGTFSGDSKIGEEGEASVTISPNSGYKVPLIKSDITVTGAIVWDYVRTSNSTATISLLGAESVVSISATCVALNSYSINITEGDHFTYSGDSSIQEDGSATLTFVPREGYYQPSDVTVDGATKSWIQATGVLTLSNPTGIVSITYTPVERILTGITISSSSGSYTLGDTFTMPTVTANYNVGASEDVTASATATGGGLENGILTSAGTKTITISYGGFNASYTATVTAITPTTAKFVKVTSGTVASGKYLIVNETAKVAFNGGINSTTYDTTSNIVSVTISSSEIAYSTAMDDASFTFDASAGTLKSAAGYYIGRTASSTGINASKTEAYTNTITVSSGTATIKASNNYVLRYNSSSGQDRFRYYSGTSVDAIQIYKYQAGTVKELKWITAEVKSGTYYQGSSVTASDFVVTGHYNDGSTSTLSTGVTVTNGYLAKIGDNEVTLTYSGKSCKVKVNAVELTSEYTGLSWAQGEYTIIDGQNIDFSKFGTVTAEYNDGETYATKAISSCTVATYSKSGDVYTKFADLDDGDTITSSLHGKYLGVTYTETNTFTAYSSAPIYVVEAINDVYKQVATYSWSKVTSLNAGDKVTFVNETAAKVASGFDSNLITVSSYDSSVSTDFYFEVGKVGDYYTFHNANGYLGNHSTGTSGNNYAYLDAEIDEENNMNYFTVSFDKDDNVVITSVYDTDRKLQFNSTRFCFYGSNQSVVQLYKGTDGYSPTGESFANTNAVVQKAVLQFAEHFNGTMDCANNGETADVASKWSTLSSDFSTAMSGFTGDDLAHFKDLFANAYSVEGGDTLQDMLARYDYIVAKYKLSNDFLHDGADRGAVQYARVTPFNIIGNNGNTVAIIVIISMISITAIGGYFFLRKRKENL